MKVRNDLSMDFFGRIENIMKLREILTIDTLAELTGLKASTLYNQRHRGQVPRAEDLKKIAEVLDVTTDYLLFGEERGFMYPASAVASNPHDPIINGIDITGMIMAIEEACLNNPELAVAFWQITKQTKEKTPVKRKTKS